LKPLSKPRIKTRRKLALWAVLTCLEALAGLVYMGSLPADPKNVVLLGYSLPRLGLMGLFLILCLSLAILTAQFYCGSRWATRFEHALLQEKNRRIMLIGTFFLTLTGWVLTFLPEYRFGGLAGYAGRMRPLFLWELLFGVQTFLLVLTWKDQQDWRTSFKRGLRSGKAGLLVLAISLAAWLFIALSGVGLKPDQVHWNDNGVPLTGVQILAALGLGLGLGWLLDRLAERAAGKSRSRKVRWWFEAAVCLGVWAAAGVIWSQTPMQRNFFAPGPYPPNYEFYPFSDSVTYDTSAQLARIGLLYSGGAHVDKPLYSFILLGLNFLSGNRFSLLLAWQAALLAALPMCAYLIGKTLHSRTAGFMAAALVVMKEINAYQTVTIQVSHSKLILSEVPTALFLAMFTYFMIRWLEENGRKTGYAALAGGTLGLATLLRHNPWFLLPLVGLAAVWVYRRNWRRLLLSGGLFGAVFMLGIVPWAVRTVQVTGSPLYFFGALRGVVWGQRYEPVLNEPAAPIPTLTLPVFPEATVGTPEPLSQDQTGGLSTAVPVPAASTATPESAGGGGKLKGVAQFVSAHFFHNLIASEFVLPTQFSLDDLQHMVSGTRSLYPVATWTGRLGIENAAMIFLSLVTVSLGVGAAWSRRGFSGMLVLFVFLGYSLASALARTSGGRYIVPVDWAIPLYFALGWVQGIRLIFPRSDGESRQGAVTQPEPAKSHDWARTALLGGGIFLVVGLALPISERLIPADYPQETLEQVSGRLNEEGVLDTLGIGPAEMEQFLNQKGAILLAGEAIYPRFYPIDEGEPDQYSYLRPMKFPRLTFTLIGEQGGFVLLPLEKSPVSFPNGRNVVVLGCQGEYVDAAAVVLTDDQSGKTWVYRRTPGAALECPLRQPVCDDNRVCR
jgi:hypothetical protein